MGLLLALLVVIAGVGYVMAQPSGKVTAISKSTPSATHPPAASPTPTVAPHSSAPVGSTLQAFTAAYGQPTVAFADSATYVTTIDHVQVRIFVALTHGTDGASHGQSLHIAPNVGGWSSTTAGAITQLFLPLDALSQGNAALADGTVYHIYQSATLAHVFPATTFTTTTHQSAPAGHFSWFCANDLSFCYLGPLTPAGQ